MEIICYPTYGYKKDGAWRIPMRVWMHTTRSLLGHPITSLMIDHSANFEDRIADLNADNERGQKVCFTFDADTASTYQVDGDPPTDDQGLIVGDITLDADEAKNLLALQKSQNGWLSYKAVAGGVSSPGLVQLLESKDGAVSVVSDIDDTIKITEIPAGTEIVLRNTFRRDFVAVPEMAQIYRAMYQDPTNASFHYVSGGPWQLYRPLAEFLIKQEGFPAGSFQMRTVNRKFSAAGFVSDLKLLVEDGFSLSAPSREATRQHKVDRITELMTNLPERQFYLFGDSGELDPEAYDEIRKKFPARVKEIIIRDVVNAALDKPPRLTNMTVRHAPTIVKGKSQFDS
jgi:phosphatidate phosphatase APP1